MTKTRRKLRQFAAIASKALREEGCEFSVGKKDGNFYTILCNGKVMACVYEYACPTSCLCAITTAIVDKLWDGDNLTVVVWSGWQDDVFYINIKTPRTKEYDITWEVELTGRKVVLREKKRKYMPTQKDEAKEMSVKDYFERLVSTMLLIRQVSKYVTEGN
jgi:hypothetical protein